MRPDEAQDTVVGQRRSGVVGRGLVGIAARLAAPTRAGRALAAGLIVIGRDLERAAIGGRPRPPCSFSVA